MFAALVVSAAAGLGIKTTLRLPVSIVDEGVGVGGGSPSFSIDPPLVFSAELGANLARLASN